MTDIERINGELDNPQVCLLALADAYEELGDTLLAGGYRLLHKHGRWPEWVNYSRYYQWRQVIQWRGDKYLSRIPSDCPIYATTFYRRSGALEAAAKAMARWNRGDRVHSYGGVVGFRTKKPGSSQMSPPLILGTWVFKEGPVTLPDGTQLPVPQGMRPSEALLRHHYQDPIVENK